MILVFLLLAFSLVHIMNLTCFVKVCWAFRLYCLWFKSFAIFCPFHIFSVCEWTKSYSKRLLKYDNYTQTGETSRRTWEKNWRLYWILNLQRRIQQVAEESTALALFFKGVTHKIKHLIVISLISLFLEVLPSIRRSLTHSHREAWTIRL